ncbi:Mitotic spindle checkpoint component mad2 [Coemansia sp. S610]|uniref:Mitotic spindle checkpoint component mad2 n=2 Tax=Coemansia TaxID=4863 RepID=A0A9W8L3P6_9FUNG|nr:Mitotic spindle checkpoint component mad2 [Coemansia sp. RSA 2675]KAJ2016484.1 Mitotic spindle checkpoint component mad2 [Coemansia sp. S85]KAJ2027366.1 Mitotic spindle checkpoint component mad2 [Coemansia sp. S610]KAJ2415997.1 Mitotic spindle checkpoint component mad2 [Coemansia sp. RSA 2530]KAJ2688327.1 Mitotic spindle checkpoint component mad2 [Coemansia spiralis]KAJ2702005.1 Mitotic spindle checkpoint component mad2 [Coemansia sp. IMI 209128]KAJ2792596.1 Mitotic spindle checkpoint comp
MSVQTQLTKGKIDLKGSAQIVTEFFLYGLNSILFQRGLYPVEDFDRKKKYGIDVWVSNDATVKDYLQKIMESVEEWISAGKISKLVLAIKSRESRETLERWQFDVQLVEEGEKAKGPKSEKTLQMEIQAIFRQIAASVSFLPIVEEKCTFNILVYTSADAEVPTTWADSDPLHIKNPEQVRLRSFATDAHRVEAMVAYRRDPDLC